MSLLNNNYEILKSLLNKTKYKEDYKKELRDSFLY